MTQNTADQLRMRLKQARSAIAVADRQRASLLLRARLFTWLATTRSAHPDAPPQIVAGFWPLQDEPDLRELYRQWHASGIVVALPVMQAAHKPLIFRAWQPESPLVSAAFGVLEPSGSQAVEPDVVLVPTLGFTPMGDRIGYGKGFYDRTLSHLRAGSKPLTAIGVAWDEGNLMTIEPGYQPAPHDEPLDAVITPTDWHPAAPAFGKSAS